MASGKKISKGQQSKRTRLNRLNPRDEKKGGRKYRRVKPFERNKRRRMDAEAALKQGLSIYELIARRLGKTQKNVKKYHNKTKGKNNMPG